MSHAVSIPPAKTLYDEDLVLWAKEQARLLEERRFGQLDIVNLIDEVRSMGASEKREIRNRLEVLVAHLLKWRYQPGRRGSSWQRTIIHQRTMIRDIVETSPSLERYPAQILDRTFVGARLEAASETGIDFTLFPETPPFTIDEILDDEFLPREPDLETPDTGAESDI